MAKTGSREVITKVNIKKNNITSLKSKGRVTESGYKIFIKESLMVPLILSVRIKYCHIRINYIGIKVIVYF